MLIKNNFKALGTDIEIKIVVENHAEAEAVKREIRDIKNIYSDFELIFSRFNPSSQLSKLNNQLGCKMSASEHLLTVCRHALDYYKLSDGYFDPRIISVLENSGYKTDFDKIGNFNCADSGALCDKDFAKDLESQLVLDDNGLCFFHRMDFAGNAKGYITDQVSSHLKSKGWKNFLISSGGDMYLAGHGEKGETWYIDIEGISYESLMLELSEKGVATTGIGKRKWENTEGRFHHLVNPKKTKEYLFDIKSVTVVAEKTEDADAWAKVLFLMGIDEARKFAEKNNIACALLDYRSNAWISSSLKKFIHKSI